VQYGPKLAAALNNAAVIQSALDRRNDAISSNDESVALYRKLARMRPAVFSVELARTLYVAAEIRVESGMRPDEALALADESLAVLNGLHGAVPQLVTAIRHNARFVRAQALLALGRMDEAVPLLESLQSELGPDL
jgi:tetratricopeptide (TPR) repeat protein